MKAALTGTLMCAILFLCVGCSDRNEKPVALLLLKAMDNPFFQDIEQGVRASWGADSKSPSLHVRAGAKEGDVSGQRQVLEEYIARYVEGRKHPILVGVLLTPSASGTELTSYIKQLRDRKIPVILIDTKISEDALAKSNTDYSVYIGSSNRQGGELAAQVLIQLLPTGGDVLLLNGVDGHETAQERRSGFIAQLEAKSKADPVMYQIVERTCNWRRTEAQSTVDGLLAMGRTFDGIFAANDEMALGAIEALRQNEGVKRPSAVIGFDAIDEARVAVKEGRLSATIAQDPYFMGQKAAEALFALVRGEVPPKNEIVPVKIVDK